MKIDYGQITQKIQHSDTASHQNIASVAVQNNLQRTGILLADIIQKHIPNQLYDIKVARNHNWVSAPYPVSNNIWRIDINIPDDLLYRPSLYPASYPNGATNILALFNHGYSASKYAYGWWETADKTVRSLRVREPLRFMEEAINEFNSLPESVGCNATLDGIYL